MTRKIKSLGLAFVAVLAMSAVVASAAQAVPTFTASSYPATATGAQGAGNETFTTSGGTVQCDSHFLVGAVGGGDIPEGGATQVTATPSYSNCEAFGFLNADVHENSCDYVFTATELVSSGVYNHHVKLDCPGTNGGMVITAATCELIIPETGNSNLTTVKTTNVGSGDSGTVTVQPDVKNVTANVLKDGFGCPFSGTGHTLGQYHGHVVLDHVTAGKGISVSG